MCGIFSYVGTSNNAAAKTLLGLCDLEYRGYDSWGVAWMNGGKTFDIKKSIGKISDVPKMEFEGALGNKAIGHSRWGTHGDVTELNAHPHTSRDGSVAVVHNGIIVNHNDIRKRVTEKLGNGTFVSETDTEVIPHLIQLFMEEGATFEEAFVHAARDLEGRFAFVAMHSESPHVLAARDGSPLLLGEAPDGIYFASDAPAFLDFTRRVDYLGDREYVKADMEGFTIRNLDTGIHVKPKIVEIEWSKQDATRDGYDHYMLKEIMEQGVSLDKAIRQEEEKLAEFVELARGKELFLTGCGTAAKMAMVGQYLFSEIAGRRTTSFVSSEFELYRKFVDKKSLVLAVSQSGETADGLETLGIAEKSGAKLVSLLNVVGSSMDRMSDLSLFINAGPEKAVASTKAATAQIAVLTILAYALAGKLEEGKDFMRGAVSKIKEWLTVDIVRETKKVAERIVQENDIYIIGRGLNSAVALEAAIKIQEVSYIHAEGFAGGEIKHGPIALIRKGTPCIVFIPNDETKRDMESNATELKSRGAYIIGVSPESSPLFDEWIEVPDLGITSPIGNIIPIQILAYHLAVLRGNNPDMPRNLAKSVTVK